VPQLLKLQVKDARSVAASAGVVLDLRPPSALDTDVVTDQRPIADELVEPGTRVLVTARPVVVNPSTAPRTTEPALSPTAGESGPGYDLSATPQWLPAAAISGSILLLVLVVLLVLYTLLVHRPKQARWVRGHVRARAVNGPVGGPTIGRSGTAGDLSVHIHLHIDAGSHMFEEINPVRPAADRGGHAGRRLRACTRGHRRAGADGLHLAIGWFLGDDDVKVEKLDASTRGGCDALTRPAATTTRARSPRSRCCPPARPSPCATDDPERRRVRHLLDFPAHPPGSTTSGHPKSGPAGGFTAAVPGAAAR
jgi:hypothetical protein